MSRKRLLTEWIAMHCNLFCILKSIVSVAISYKMVVSRGESESSLRE